MAGADGDFAAGDGQRAVGMGHIAAVTEDNVGTFLGFALDHGTGAGCARGYKFKVVYHGEGRNMAVFLDGQRELRAAGRFAALSAAAMLACTALVCGIIVLCSRRAIDPVVKSAERQKQFITDAGHELKTPITVIATSLKVLEMEVGPQKWIDKAENQTEKLRDLVNALVSLSRMDEEDSPLQLRPFPVSDAVRETAESFRDYAEAAGHSLELDIEPDLTFCGDEYAVRQLGSILLDNAVKYALPETPIALSLHRDRRTLVLRTVNACEPLEPEELGKRFDRFYRTDKARCSGGFGIGLSLARSIAEAHRGTLTAQTGPDGTIEFRAELREAKPKQETS